jgi:hypothetical protein
MQTKHSYSVHPSLAMVQNVLANLKTKTPKTQTRIDLGLSLRDQKPPKRLVPAPHPERRDRITHIIGITSVADVDDTVARWLRAAYEGSE